MLSQLLWHTLTVSLAPLCLQDSSHYLKGLDKTKLSTIFPSSHVLASYQYCCLCLLDQSNIQRTWFWVNPDQTAKSIESQCCLVPSEQYPCQDQKKHNTSFYLQGSFCSHSTSDLMWLRQSLDEMHEITYQNFMQILWQHSLVQTIWIAILKMLQYVTFAEIITHCLDLLVFFFQRRWFIMCMFGRTYSSIGLSKLFLWILHIWQI